jgi:hypothetical protein
VPKRAVRSLAERHAAVDLKGLRPPPTNAIHTRISDSGWPHPSEGFGASWNAIAGFLGGVTAPFFFADASWW